MDRNVRSRGAVFRHVLLDDCLCWSAIDRFLEGLDVPSPRCVLGGLCIRRPLWDQRSIGPNALTLYDAYSLVWKYSLDGPQRNGARRAHTPGSFRSAFEKACLATSDFVLMNLFEDCSVYELLHALL